MYRQAIARQARLFSTSFAARKSAVDAAKETVHQADKTVAQQIVKGIEKGGMTHGRGAAASMVSIEG